MVVREWKEERSSSASSLSSASSSKMYMRMERGTTVICIFSIFNIFVQDVHVPYYNHAAGSQASMIIGKILALISLRGVVSSQRLHGVVIDTTLLATGSSYGKILAQEQRQVLSGLPAARIIKSLFQQGAEHKALISAPLEDQED
jgi:hypothetical protein